MRIVVVGLGYVGLPLAIALARRFDVTGVDISATRIAELQAGRDRTGEIEAEELAQTRLQLSTDGSDCRGADLYIVTVPTPVDEANVPDLGPLLSACRSVAWWIERGHPATVEFESTL